MKILLFNNWKKGIIYLLSMVTLIAIVLTIVFNIQSKALRVRILESINSDIELYAYDIDDKIASIAADVFLLEDLVVTKDSLVLNNGTTDVSSPMAREHIEGSFVDWLTNRNVYDQIRILDNNGMELIRVNYNNGSPEAVAPSNLQNKGGRYYFENSIGLSDDSLYISKLDLNKENGIIEIVDGEYKPMLRLASPLYSIDGDKLGILILNFLSVDLFHSADSYQFSEYTSFEVINENGYFVHSMIDENEFGFMFDDKQDEIFSKYHSYDILNISENGITQEDDGDELYTSIQISERSLSESVTISIDRDITVVSESGSLYVFGEIEFKDTEDYRALVTTYIILGIIGLGFSYIVSRLVDELEFQRSKQLASLEYTSKHDTLTGLPNRSNVFELIDYKIGRLHEFCVLFLDFDGFKLINDNFGHDIGDLALIEGSKRLKSAVRHDDVVARVGGDEFIIILNDLKDVLIVERICKNLIKSMSVDFELKGNICEMGISIGAVINDHDSDTETLIKKADEMMYEVKNASKNSYKIHT